MAKRPGFPPPFYPRSPCHPEDLFKNFCTPDVMTTSIIKFVGFTQFDRPSTSALLPVPEYGSGRLSLQAWYFL